MQEDGCYRPHVSLDIGDVAAGNHRRNGPNGRYWNQPYSSSIRINFEINIVNYLPGNSLEA